MKKQIFAGVLATAMAVTCAATVSAVEKVDAITGNLEVVDFFSASTGAIELKSGDSYTISFHNKSNGTAFYENYVLAITGEIGDKYTGAAEEILIVRADNWGWGGGYSTFGQGNFLDLLSGAVEGSHVFDMDYDNWSAEMAAGVDVSITLSRDGDTLNYNAKIGKNSNGISLKSGVALPESVYVFLTGDHVSLTNIKTVNNNAPAAPAETTPAEETPAETTPAPAAGDETPAETTPAPAAGDNTPAETTPAPAAGDNTPAETTAAPAPGNTNTATPDKTTPDTGVEGVAVVAGLAIVAAGAIVVAKKRK